MFLFEKRLGLRHSLTQLIKLGEQLEFEAVPSEVGSNINNYTFCPMSATIVWRGNRPQVDTQRLDSPTTLTGSYLLSLKFISHISKSILFFEVFLLLVRPYYIRFG